MPSGLVYTKLVIANKECSMRVQEYGRGNPRVIVLIHPSIVMWDYFEYVIPLLQGKYHLIIPVLPGYDPENDSDFTSVEEIAAELAEILQHRQIAAIDCLYGCSMGVPSLPASSPTGAYRYTVPSWTEESRRISFPGS